MLSAYRVGIFPMAEARDDPDVFWVEPRRRAILPPGGFHCSRSLARALRRGRTTVTCNEAFAAVLAACAESRTDAEGGETWINARLAATYAALHAAGHAHSIEVWAGEGEDRRLVGGLFGVGFARVFCGESMFSRVPDASKIALAWLVVALRLAGTELLDCQFMTPHLASLGAVEISRAAYQRRLIHAQRAEPGDYAGGASSLATGGGGVASAPGAAGVAAWPEGAAGDLRAGLPGVLKSLASSSSPGNFIAQSLTQTS